MKNAYDDLNIRHFKLVSGDDVIGLVAGLEKDTGSIYLEYPVKLDYIKHDNTMNYIMSDYIPTSKKNIIMFNPNTIVAQSDVVDLVKKEYIQYCINEQPETLNDDIKVDNTYH